MKTTKGHCRCLGATLEGDGANFALWARLASRVELLLFASPDDRHPKIIPLCPKVNRSAYYWHVHVPHIQAGQLYGWCLTGPWRPYQGVRFDPDKVLVDPYARAVVLGNHYNRQAAARAGDNRACCAKSVVVDLDSYDWGDDVHPAHSLSRTILYELHVAGFTRDPSAGILPQHRGTYAGLVDKIPYLMQLGISTVLLMPVFQFDPQAAPQGLTNYWGDAPLSVFAPHSGYATEQGAQAVDEFRDMVKALHQAGMEVILDVDYGHTAEGDAQGPVLNYRGIDTESYYQQGSATRAIVNSSGSGNALNTAHPVTQRLILDSLRHWRSRMHVDGFRFDLQPLLLRDGDGKPLQRQPLLQAVDTDPVLADCKFLARTTIPGSLYQYGPLAGARWREWNVLFQDDVRRFIKGEDETIVSFANRISGDVDVYRYRYGDAEKCIHFVTSHYGFTLWDLVSYNQKHNEENGEENKDGDTENYSWNHGIEGETDRPDINALRARQCRNLVACSLLSIGTPLLLMGDEVLRSQGGNNYVRYQDNPISWMNWEWSSQGYEMLDFVQKLNRYRTYLIQAAGCSDETSSLAQMFRHAEPCWHGVQAFAPEWDAHSHALALSALSLDTKWAIYVLFNGYWEPLLFNLPLPPDGVEGPWLRVMDTAMAPPDTIIPLGEPLPSVARNYRAEARSICLFVCGRLPPVPQGAS